MSVFESDRLLPALVAFGIGAALVWLAAELLGATRRQTGGERQRMRAATVMVLGCGLWWPGHFFDPGALPGGAIGGIPLAAGLLALALAAAIVATGECLTRRQWPAAAGLAVGTLFLAYGHGMFATPGLFRAAMAGGASGPAVAVLLLVTCLVAAAVEWTRPAVRVGVRVGTAVGTAAILTAAAALSTEGVEAFRAPWGEGVLLLAIATLATLLHLSLRDGRGPDGEGLPMRGAAVQGPTVDSLTGLPTRVYFEEQLAAAAAKADATAARLALLFIDLDGFKPVNDTYGHAVGDRVLEQVGARLKATSRGKDVVARVGGDEFLLLLCNVTSEQAVAQVAARLIASLSQPFSVEGREVAISASVGVATYPDGCSHPKLIARADAAMYASKRSGGSTHTFYSPSMDADAEAQFDLLRDLRKAVANNELELNYQPKIDAQSGKVTAVEALLRWRHPERGVILPNAFIPIAERFGLIGQIGNWVIEEACRQSRQWRDKGLRMRVAINLSAHQMRQDDIVERITGALTLHRIHPSLLTLEITETAAMEDTRTTQSTFRRLGELGTHMSIDDFGTGHSSLSYLRKLPAEELKIDRSFVMDLEHSADARAVVDAVVRLAHALGLKVVAEGVENQRQQKILVDLGCDELQGYLFAKPMSARALLLWAMNDKAEASAFRSSLFTEAPETRASA
jgi:diguanylate cyclase (GGDEF)-like protein